MTNEELQLLINREIDGEISPEEEATLMDEVSRNPELDREYRAQHALHEGFRSMPREEPAADLAGRVADVVLAAGSQRRFLSISFPMARRAALFLIVLGLGTATGVYIVDNPVAVASPGNGDSTKVDIALKWQEILGLDDQQLTMWRRIRAEHQEDLDRSPDLDDAGRQRIAESEIVAQLLILTQPQRELWRQQAGKTSEELKRLLGSRTGR